MWLSKMAYTAGCCSLKAQFIPVGIASVASKSFSNNFGFSRFEKGEIFWKETSTGFKRVEQQRNLSDHEQRTCEGILLFTACE